MVLVSPCQMWPHGTRGSAWAWRHSTPMGHCLCPQPLPPARLQPSWGHLETCTLGCEATHLWEDGGRWRTHIFQSRGCRQAVPHGQMRGACTTHGLRRDTCTCITVLGIKGRIRIYWDYRTYLENALLLINICNSIVVYLLYC